MSNPRLLLTLPARAGRTGEAIGAISEARRIVSEDGRAGGMYAFEHIARVQGFLGDYAGASETARMIVDSTHRAKVVEMIDTCRKDPNSVLGCSVEARHVWFFVPSRSYSELQEDRWSGLNQPLYEDLPTHLRAIGGESKSEKIFDELLETAQSLFKMLEYLRQSKLSP